MDVDWLEIEEMILPSYAMYMHGRAFSVFIYFVKSPFLGDGVAGFLGKGLRDGEYLSLFRLSKTNDVRDNHLHSPLFCGIMLSLCLLHYQFQIQITTKSASWLVPSRTFFFFLVLLQS